VAGDDGGERLDRLAAFRDPDAGGLEAGVVNRLQVKVVEVIEELLDDLGLEAINHDRAPGLTLAVGAGVDARRRCAAALPGLVSQGGAAKRPPATGTASEPGEQVSTA